MDLYVKSIHEKISIEDMNKKGKVVENKGEERYEDNKMIMIIVGLILILVIVILALRYKKKK